MLSEAKASQRLAGAGMGGDWVNGAVLFAREVGGDLGIGAGLAPEHDLVAPGVAEGVVVAVEFLPVVVAPQLGGPAIGRPLQDVVVILAIADQDPDPRLAPAVGQCTRLDAGGIGVRAGVGGV